MSLCIECNTNQRKDKRLLCSKCIGKRDRENARRKKQGLSPLPPLVNPNKNTLCIECAKEEKKEGCSYCRTCFNKRAYQRQKAIKDEKEPKKEKPPPITEKICTMCEIVKAIEEFRHGKNTCNKCENAKRVQHRKNKREKYRTNIIPIKCTHCNEIKNSTEFTRTGGNVCNSCFRFQWNYWYNNKKYVCKDIIYSDFKICYKCEKEKHKLEFNIGWKQCIQCHREYYTNYFIQNPIQKIRKNLNGLLRHYFNKNTKTFIYVNIDQDMLFKWFSFQFEYNPLYNFDNYGTEWHIDHVFPCSKFNLKEEDEQHKCFNWKNLQPLSGLLNQKKSNRILMSYILKQEMLVKQFNKLFDLENESDINKYFRYLADKAVSSI